MRMDSKALPKKKEKGMKITVGAKKKVVIQ
jgi:hypothetical protein